MTKKDSASKDSASSDNGEQPAEKELSGEVINDSIDGINAVNEKSSLDTEQVASAQVDKTGQKYDASDKENAAIPTLSSPIVNAPAAAKKGNSVALFALLLALIAVAGSGYIGWMLYQQTDQLHALQTVSDGHRQQSQSLQQSIASSKDSTTRSFAVSDKKIAALSAALQESNAIIEGHSRRLLSLTATTTDDWRLAEVEYLLRLANQRILTSKDGESALNLLRASDQILLELNDPRLFSVRESIAQDRAALAIVGQQDLDGVFLQLSALARVIDQLPLLVVPEFTTERENVVAATAISETEGWQQKLQAIGLSTWRELKSLLVIQSRDVDIKPLLPPEQQYYLRNNLRLLISQAQLALLDGRQTAYADSLSNASQWLDDYFPVDEAVIQAVIAELEQLQSLQVEVELPDVSNSLLAIKAFIADQHRISNGDVKADHSRDVPAESRVGELAGEAVTEEAAL
jgi:uroporphyrin-3 C-methyltransferase